MRRRTLWLLAVAVLLVRLWRSRRGPRKQSNSRVATLPFPSLPNTEVTHII